MRLLLTGFEPFGGEALNPSQEVVRTIAAEPPPGIELDTLILPVVGRISFERLLPAFDAGGYDAWLGLGEAGGRPHLSVERVGINLLVDRGPLSNDHGEQPLVEDGAAAHFSTLPVTTLAEAMSTAGAPTRVSNTAGTYICNEVLYAMGHHLATTGRAIPAGFMHLPYLPAQTTSKPAQPSMALETQVLGVRAAIAFVQELVGGRERVERSLSPSARA